MSAPIRMAGKAQMAEGCGVLKPCATTSVLDGRPGFRAALVRWFGKHGKDYPWRRTREPYAILVSEVMLQQTQIATVLGKGYFTRFLASFPDLGALAAADDAALLKAWEGLGYYRRVEDVARDGAGGASGPWRGVSTGLGGVDETAGSWALHGGGVAGVCLGCPGGGGGWQRGAGARRLMDFSGPVDETAGIKRIWEWAEALADSKRPRMYHAALMELGQAVCRPGVPDCLAVSGRTVLPDPHAGTSAREEPQNRR